MSLARPFPEAIGEATLPYGSASRAGRKLPRMRVVPKALVVGLLAACAFASACASGFERHGDDDDDQPNNTDAPIFSNGDGGITDARIDAPGQIIDAPTQVDAPTTGGIDCPDTPEYYAEALDEVLNNPNFVECSTGADCSSSQCCYGAIVCVAYP
jgi:hypothetical protein